MWLGQPPDGYPVLPADRARAVWLDDPGLSSAEVALLARCSPEQAAAARRGLVAYNLLEPRREPRRAFPQHVPLPRQPWRLTEGSCVGRLPSLWCSSDRADRAEAKRICLEDCPVRRTCLDWALHAVPTDDSAIYGGTGPAERRRLRAERSIRRPNAVAAINAAKTCCGECGLPLSGPNLITEPGRRPGTVRRRCRACTQRRKAEAYQRRREDGAAS